MIDGAVRAPRNDRDLAVLFVLGGMLIPFSALMIHSIERSAAHLDAANSAPGSKRSSSSSSDDTAIVASMVTMMATADGEASGGTTDSGSSSCDSSSASSDCSSF